MTPQTILPSQSEEIISIEEALHILRQNIPKRIENEYPIHESLGKYLAEDIEAPEPSPRFDNSAMDGFAVRWEDVARVKEGAVTELKIIGESQAGSEFEGEVGVSEAIRISTGALLANGCDTVIRVEDTEEDGNRVRIKKVRKQGQDVRYRGEEFQPGDALLHKGTRIAAPQAALLAAVGIDAVTAYKPCDVVILSTGSELVSTGQSIGKHQIRDSNMIMLEAAVSDAGAIVKESILVHDDEEATVDAIAGSGVDVILCTGGISVGRHDHVKEAALKNGYTPLFWRIRQKPGKPLFFARKENTLLFGLPGNPVSAFMCFTHYVKPLLANLNGLTFGWPTISGEAGTDIVNSGTRTNMIRVCLEWRQHGGYRITDAARQGSHMLTSLSESDGYIILEPGQVLARGERIDVHTYDFLRESV